MGWKALGRIPDCLVNDGRRQFVNSAISNSGSSALAQAQLSQEISMSLLKQAQQAQTQSTAALLNAVPPPPPPPQQGPAASGSLPAHLGQNINVTA